MNRSLIQPFKPGLWKPGDPLPPMMGGADMASSGGGGKISTYGAITATSLGTLCTASTTANTKGSWAELVSAAGNDRETDWILVTVRANNDGISFLTDIGIGANPNEEVLIPDLLYDVSLHSTFNNMRVVRWLFPFHIRENSRISARCQQTGTAGGTGTLVTVQLMEGGFMLSTGFNVVEAWGADTGATGGQSVDPGGTINTLGSWAELTSSSGLDAKALIVTFGNQLNSARTKCDWLVDIGIGANPNEEVIIPQIHMNHSETGVHHFTHGQFGPYMLVVPGGTRVSARAQCDINDATDRILDVVVYAIGD